jgi:hypothetical protein
MQLFGTLKWQAVFQILYPTYFVCKILTLFYLHCQLWATSRQSPHTYLFIFFLHCAQKFFKTDPEGTTCKNMHRLPWNNKMGFKEM